MYDILNQFYLDIEISHISTNETELAKKNLNHLKRMNIKQPVLVIFDRGYPSIEFVDFLETEKINYLFRLSSNDYKFERNNMVSTDEAVILRHTHQQLEKIRKRHPDRFEHMKEKVSTHTRIMTSILPSGKELALMTNLPFEISQKELEDLLSLIYIKESKSWVDVNKEFYTNYYRDINTYRKRQQEHGRCVCPASKRYLCDMDCMTCPYAKAGNQLSLDNTVSDGEGNEKSWLDDMPDESVPLNASVFLVS